MKYKRGYHPNTIKNRHKGYKNLKPKYSPITKKDIRYIQMMLDIGASPTIIAHTLRIRHQNNIAMRTAYRWIHNLDEIRKGIK